MHYYFYSFLQEEEGRASRGRAGARKSEKAMSIPSKSQPSSYFRRMTWIGILWVSDMGCGQNVDSVLVYSVRT